MTLCVSRSEVAMAYSATTVLPAEVCADTRTDCEFSMHRIASLWNGSSTNGYSCVCAHVCVCMYMHTCTCSVCACY